VIDLGPEGGDEGGRVVAAGTPEQVARNQQSHTGKYLARVLNGARNGNGNGSGANHGNHAAAPADAAVPDLPTE
jgi:excinuclease ABC subunit A